MKKIFIALFLIFSLVSCNNLLSGNQDFSFSNCSLKDVYITSSGKEYFIRKDDKLIIPALPTSEFKIAAYYRCELNYSYLGNYQIIEKTPSTISVYNSSTHTIVLSDKNKNIGTYDELLAKSISLNCSISDVSVEIVIPPNSIKTFSLFTNKPNYIAYFSDNNMPADLALLSFE